MNGNRKQGSASQWGWHVVAVGGLLLLGFALRVVWLDAQNIWGDEAWSYTVSGWPLADVIASDAETNPPLYHVLLFGMRRLLGISPFALRYLSVICGVLATAILYRTGVAVAGPRTGVWTLGVAVVSPFLVYYSQEARMYGPALVGASGSLLFFVVLFRQTRRGRQAPPTQWLWYGFFSLVGVLSHYHVFAMLVGQAIFVAGWAVGGSALVPAWRRLRPWLAAWVVMALLFLPWLWVHGQFLGGKVSARFEVWTVAWLGEIAGRTLTAFGVGTTVNSAETIWAVPVIALAAVGAWMLWRDRRWPAALLVIILGVGLLFGWLVNPIMPFFYERYLLVLLPPFALLVGTGVAGFGRKHPILSLIPFTFVLLAAGVSLQNYFFDDAYAKGGYGDLMATIAAQQQPGDLILLNNPLQASLYDYYAPDDAVAEIVPRDRLLADAATYMAQATDGFRRVWLVEHGNSAEYDPERAVNAWLAEQGSFAGFTSYPGSQLSLYVLGAPQTADNPVDVTFGEQIRLTGYTLETDQVTAGQPVLLTLFWEGIRPIDRDYTVFVHVLDDAGRLVAQTDGQPNGGARPTSGWQPGEPVRDSYAVSLPPGLASGEYNLLIGLYLWPELTRLATTEGNDSVELQRLVIP